MKKEKEKEKEVETKKKTVARAKKSGKKEIFFQYQNQEISMQLVIEKVREAYKAEGLEVSDADDVRIYVKPEENMLYYVVNDKFASGINMYD